MVFHGTSANEFDDFYPMQHFGSAKAAHEILQREVLNKTYKNSQQIWQNRYMEVLKHLLQEEGIDFDAEFDEHGNWMRRSNNIETINDIKEIIEEAKGAANFARRIYVQRRDQQLKAWELDPSIHEVPEKTRIVPVFLKITSPKRIEDYGGGHEPLEWIDELARQGIISDQIVTELVDAMYDIRGHYEWEAEILKKQYEEIAEYLTSNHSIDGFVYKNESEDIGVDSWVPMWNAQIYPAVEAVAANEGLGGNWVEQELDRFYSISKD
jgi:predicted house-cleaning noncanonical NTP pyrophosphatase (MazG superfamily)